MVLLHKRTELPGGDWSAAADADYPERNQAKHGFPAEEFCAGIPVCDGRFAGAVNATAAQHAEPFWIAICGVHADLRAGHFEG